LQISKNLSEKDPIQIDGKPVI